MSNAGVLLTCGQGSTAVATAVIPSVRLPKFPERDIKVYNNIFIFWLIKTIVCMSNTGVLFNLRSSEAWKIGNEVWRVALTGRGVGGPDPGGSRGGCQRRQRSPLRPQVRRASHGALPGEGAQGQSRSSDGQFVLVERGERLFQERHGESVKSVMEIKWWIWVKWSTTSILLLSLSLSLLSPSLSLSLSLSYLKKNPF